jgi:thiol-disulfide isomerase/thioredoxin
MMRTRLGQLAPLVVVAAGFILVPMLMHRLFPDTLPTELPALNAQPQPLPEFEFTDASGAKVTLAQFHGSMVLLNFWATWCVPCQMEMPSLNALAARMNDMIVIVPVSVDASGATAVPGYYRRYGLDRLPVFLDPLSNAMHRLAVIGIPTTLLIDRDGREIARQVGAAQWDSPAIVEELAKLTVTTETR